PSPPALVWATFAPTTPVISEGRRQERLVKSGAAALLQLDFAEQKRRGDPTYGDGARLGVAAAVVDPSFNPVADDPLHGRQRRTDEFDISNATPIPGLDVEHVHLRELTFEHLKVVAARRSLARANMLDDGGVLAAFGARPRHESRFELIAREALTPGLDDQVGHSRH